MKYYTSLTLAAAVHFSLALQCPAQDANDSPAETPAAATAETPAETTENATAASEKEDAATVAAAQKKFTNLPEEKRQEFSQRLTKAQNLFNQKRVFDALQEVDELDKIFVDHPAAMNIRGAAYVEIRAFNKAYPIFEKILKFTPKSTNVRFNLAEIDFVTKKWKSAEKRFTEVISLLPASNKAMIRLCEFKILLCQLKTDRLDEAIALRDKYDSWDDSPFYYYSRAAVLFHEGDKEAAEKLLLDARFVWSSDASLSSWQDTMIEFGYVRSFYGGDNDEDEIEPALIKPGNAPVIQLGNP